MTRPLAVFTLLVSIVACTPDASTPTEPSTTGPTPDELFAIGPYPVGYRQVDVIYTPAGGDGERTIPVEIWYPAAAAGRPATYAVAGVISLQTDGAYDEPAPAKGPFPVAAYSHGNGGVGLVGYPYGEHLASHGWVVVAPDHTGNTALDFFLGVADPFARAALNRPQDLSAVLDWLEDLTDDPLAGLADTTEVLAFGHSFGGYTTFALGGAVPSLQRLGADNCPNAKNPNCAVLEDPDVIAAFAAGFEDPRAVALLPQAPAIGSFDPAELTAIDRPTMLQSGRLDRTTTQETSAEPAWAALDGTEDVWIEIEAGGHFTFLSICDDLEPDVIAAFQPDAPDDGCGPEFIPASEALPVLNAYVLGWARLQVLGEADWAPIVYGPPLAPGFAVTLP